MVQKDAVDHMLDEDVGGGVTDLAFDERVDDGIFRSDHAVEVLKKNIEDCLLRNMLKT